MLPAGQKLVEGIKLRAVTHVLVHVQDLRQDATTQTHTFSPQRATLQDKREKNGYQYQSPLGIGIGTHFFLLLWLQHMFTQPFIEQQGQIFGS